MAERKTEQGSQDDLAQTYAATLCFIIDTIDTMPQDLRYKVAGYLKDSLADGFVNVILTNPWRRLSNVDASTVDGNINFVIETLKGDDPDRDRVVSMIRSRPGPRRMEY
ncbi:MAG: hypothetical protein Q7S88_01345 [Candidatus Daviesbacteria bacterium]|nr:hypothetical protein [Candidatus Daviesbacteria bacterium]